MKICSIDGCKNKRTKKGFCNKHYSIWYRQTEHGKKIARAYNKTEKRKIAEIKRSREYQQTEAGKEVKRRSDNRQKEKYPERIRAREIAQYRIKRQECEVDNCYELGERHHDNYLKPLEVQFLCSNHHRELHMN